MTTVRDLSNRVGGIINELIVLRSNITDSFDKLTKLGSSQKVKFEGQIRDLKEEADKYDTEFRQHEQLLQQTGGKPRHQTLQEFVLLFFYTSFTLISLSLAIYSYVKTQTYGNSIKIILLMLFIALLITAIIIRYA
jgi:hypothetical protein